MATTKTKKDHPQPTGGPRTYEAQPHQVVLVNVGSDTPELAIDKSMRRASSDQPAIVFRPHVPTLTPRYMLANGTDVASLLKAGVLEVAADQRGVPAEYIDAQVSQDRAAVRDGRRPEPNKQERVNHWKSVVISESLAMSIAEALMALGLPDDMHDPDTARIAKDLCGSYDRAFLESKAFDEPWRARAAELVAIGRAAAAGLVDVNEEG
jgi:hypothetical protein